MAKQEHKLVMRGPRKRELSQPSLGALRAGQEADEAEAAGAVRGRVLRRHYVRRASAIRALHYGRIWIYIYIYILRARPRQKVIGILRCPLFRGPLIISLHVVI